MIYLNIIEIRTKVVDGGITLTENHIVKGVKNIDEALTRIVVRGVDRKVADEYEVVYHAVYNLDNHVAY